MNSGVPRYGFLMNFSKSSGIFSRSSFFLDRMSQNVYDVSVQSRLFRLAPAAAISIRLETSELLVTPGSKITFVRFLHSSNAKLSIFSIVGGSVISFNSVLPANAELGISFISVPFSNFTVSRLPHFANADSLSFQIKFGITRLRLKSLLN